MNASVFRMALAAGDVTLALLHAPFAYTSSNRTGAEFTFRIDSGPHRGAVGRHATLLGAVRAALRNADVVSGSTRRGGE